MNSMQVQNNFNETQKEIDFEDNRVISIGSFIVASIAVCLFLAHRI